MDALVNNLLCLDPLIWILVMFYDVVSFGVLNISRLKINHVTRSGRYAQKPNHANGTEEKQVYSLIVKHLSFQHRAVATVPSGVHHQSTVITRVTRSLTSGHTVVYPEHLWWKPTCCVRVITPVMVCNILEHFFSVETSIVHEPRYEKNNDVVFEQVRHKPSWTSIEDG